MTTAGPETSLERDLKSVSRDGLYRALSYLERRGAPVEHMPPEIDRLRAQAVIGLEWMATRDDRVQIAVDYEAVLEESSPLFRD